MSIQKSIPGYEDVNPSLVINFEDMTLYHNTFTAPVEGAIERLREGVESLATGQYPLSYNSLGAGPVASSNDVTAAMIAGSPLVAGQGSNTGRKFLLPNVVKADATSLSTTDVREGRLTMLSNLSTVPRTVEVTSGCKFNMTGSFVTAPQTIPAKTTWLISPGIYSKGDKVWTFIGSMVGDPSAPAAGGTSTRVPYRNLSGANLVSTTNVTRAQVANTRVIEFKGTSQLTGSMPNVVAHDAANIDGETVRQGYQCTFMNTGTGNVMLTPSSNQSWLINGVPTVGNRYISPGEMETWFAGFNGSSVIWVLMSRSQINGSSTEIPQILSRVSDLFTRIDNKRHSYSKGSTTLSAQQLTSSVAETYGGSSDYSLTLPKIVMEDTPAGSGQVHHGKMLWVVNSSDANRRIIPADQDFFQISGSIVQGQRVLPPTQNYAIDSSV